MDEQEKLETKIGFAVTDETDRLSRKLFSLSGGERGAFLRRVLNSLVAVGDYLEFRDRCNAVMDAAEGLSAREQHDQKTPASSTGAVVDAAKRAASTNQSDRKASGHVGSPARQDRKKAPGNAG